MLNIHCTLQHEHAQLLPHLYPGVYQVLAALVKLDSHVFSLVMPDISLLDNLHSSVEMMVDGREIHLIVQVGFVLLSLFFM